MKRGPKYRRDYYDDTLLYCLDNADALNGQLIDRCSI